MFQYACRMAIFSSFCLILMMGHITEASDGFTPSNAASDNIHMILFYLCSSMIGAIFIVLIYSLVKHRQAKGKQAIHFHKQPGFEIIWTTIPFLILVALAIPAIIEFMHDHV